jgi:hypothetical protein
MTIKYTTLPWNIQNGHKICTYQYVPLQGSPKFTQIGSFGLKLYHLATLLWTTANWYQWHTIHRTIQSVAFLNPDICNHVQRLDRIQTASYNATSSLARFEN